MQQSKVELQNIFAYMSELASCSLKFYREFIEHPGMKGQASEQFWIELLRKYLPSQYGIDSGKVIDCKGNTSRQIDIIIYNKEIFPCVFLDNQTIYIPAESVVCIFEVKQELTGEHVKYAAEIIESVRNLERSFLDNAGRRIEAESKYPYLIFGGILSTGSNLSEESLKTQLSNLSGRQTIDFGCCAENYSFYIKYSTPDGLSRCYNARKINSTNIYSNNPLLVFLFQLMHTLQQNMNTKAYMIDFDSYLNTVDSSITQRSVATPLF